MTLLDRVRAALGLDDAPAPAATAPTPPPSPADPPPAPGPIGEDGLDDAVLDLVQLIVEDYERWCRTRYIETGTPPVSVHDMALEYRGLVVRRLVGRILRKRLEVRFGTAGEVAGYVIDAMKADRVQED